MRLARYRNMRKLFAEFHIRTRPCTPQNLLCPKDSVFSLIRGSLLRVPYKLGNSPLCFRADIAETHFSLHRIRSAKRRTCGSCVRYRCRQAISLQREGGDSDPHSDSADADLRSDDE